MRVASGWYAELSVFAEARSCDVQCPASAAITLTVESRLPPAEHVVTFVGLRALHVRLLDGEVITLNSTAIEAALGEATGADDRR